MEKFTVKEYDSDYTKNEWHNGNFGVMIGGKFCIGNWTKEVAERFAEVLNGEIPSFDAEEAIRELEQRFLNSSNSLAYMTVEEIDRMNRQKELELRERCLVLAKGDTKFAQEYYDWITQKESEPKMYYTEDEMREINLKAAERYEATEAEKAQE